MLDYSLQVNFSVLSLPAVASSWLPMKLVLYVLAIAHVLFMEDKSPTGVVLCRIIVCAMVWLFYVQKMDLTFYTIGLSNPSTKRLSVCITCITSAICMIY